MSLDVSIFGHQHVKTGDNKPLEKIEVVLYSANITHNLSDMASEANLFEALWRPFEIGVTQAKDLTPILIRGLKELKSDPMYYKKYDDPEGWGVYDDFVPFVEKYLNACRLYPDQFIRINS